MEKCQQVLLENGFIQGHIRGRKIIKATREEIILSRMNYGETIPFCKFWEGRYLCVDINFSLDYKPMKDNTVTLFFVKNHPYIFSQRKKTIFIKSLFIYFY